MYLIDFICILIDKIDNIVLKKNMNIFSFDKIDLELIIIRKK